MRSLTLLEGEENSPANNSIFCGGLLRIPGLV